MPLETFIFRLACALLAGVIIGTQRELKQRQAGLTTNSLVAVGACIFILISESVIMNARLAAAVGCLCGYGMWEFALIAVSVIILINWGLKGIELYIKRLRRGDDEEDVQKKMNQ